ncbi:hypothetical protein BDV96DRAFT_609096 [Lophiotrema nucula]|uniref:Flavin-binding monooxygenase-like protein-like protein n=1 Tax=Lophiotrema nucula TaxID=690887 RepID=A0A6A5ZT30_9PLEO|nr:hypothetical protein BDV96DRAFT_609096 [Lophiotrema nucula]
MAEHEVDLVVVGAGLYGIAAACTYRRLHPTARLLLIEAAPSIGGPWAPNRIFPGLKTNNLWGTYEFPDFPMHEDKFGVKKGEHVPAEKVTEYFRAAIDEGGIAESVRLNTKVDVIERTEEGWKLHCMNREDGIEAQPFTIKTPKLILSTGLTNQPAMPKYPSSPSFTSPIIHSKDFPSHYPTIVQPGKHTLVIGVGKSAWDIAYACATKENGTATMLIRPSGNGPVWLSPTHVTPLGLWLEKLVFTRFFGFMSPCPWAETNGFEGWVRGFLHHTWLGRKIVGAFWGILGDDVVQLNKLNDHPETKKLRPWRNAFEVGNALSILNYPTDFFDLVRCGRIKVVVDEVASFSGTNEVSLKGGDKMHVDAVVCATGWKIGGSVKFKPEGLENELGLPTSSHPDIDDTALVKRAEAELYAKFPFLKERDSSRIHHPDPALRHEQTADEVEEADQHPYRLYRFLAPTSDLERRSIGFAGALMTLGNASCAYLQSLWLTAYLDGTLPLPSVSSSSELEKVRYETYKETQYCALRNAMGYGNKFPDLVFDSLPYFDLLMGDLGFKGKRKQGECFQSYGPEDYRGLVEQWEERVGHARATKKKM